MAMGATSGGLQLAGSLQQAQALRSQSRYEAAIAAGNARLSEIQAQGVTRAGEEAAQERLKQGAQLQGRQRAAAASQGILADFGTPLEIQAQTRANAAQDAESIRLDAFRQAWGFRMEGQQFRHRAKAIRSAGRFAAGQTAITGGLQFANSLAQANILAQEFRDSGNVGFRPEDFEGDQTSAFRFRSR